MNRLLLAFWLAAALVVPALVHAEPKNMAGMEMPRVKELSPPPAHLPGWMSGRKKNHIFYKQGVYNFDVYNIPRLALDLNAVAVGHAMAYEDMVTGKAGTLETATFDRINWVLKNPPKLMPDEAAISPTFGRVYGILEQVFDWTHILHAQTLDVLASKDMSEDEKDGELQALWKYYFETVLNSRVQVATVIGFDRASQKLLLGTKLH
jgi:hypothetical protein